MGPSVAEMHLLCQCLRASFLSPGICIQQCEKQTTEPEHKFRKCEINFLNTPQAIHRCLK